VAITTGILKETFPGERRVAVTPRSCDILAKAKIQIVMERGAGTAAGFTDEQYASRGVQLTDRAGVFAAADVVVQVRALGANPDAGRADLGLLRPGQVVIGFGEPLTALPEAAALAATGASFLAMELMPRITRAQSMDALSSMATITGYRAVLLAASEMPKMLPMLMTAAGTITPAKILILGAGVAGLQAIATARRLGAIVSAYDVRAAAKEQVESVGGKFIELPIDSGAAEGQGGYAKAMDEEFYRRQRELLTEVLREQDAVVTTAAVPGRKAPVLITREMVEVMMPGAVIVDVAAERGGNCALTRPGETVHHAGVTILGPLNMPSLVPFHASQMYSGNVTAFLKLLISDGELHLDLEDEIVRETLVTHGGDVVHEKIKAALAAAKEEIQA